MPTQVTVDGNDLDNDSWRFIVEETGDDIGLDGQRALVCDFIIQADDQATLDSRYASTRDDFIKQNARVLVTHGTGVFADVSPGDGTHTDTSCTIGLVAGKVQTGYRYYCRFFCVAGVTIFNAGGAAGGGDTAYTGLASKVVRTRMNNQGGVQSRQVLLTFGTTYNGTANGPYTISSVADSGGKAVVTLGSTPPAFSEGMRLEVSGSTSANGSGYNGVHLVTAISGHDVTLDTAFDGDETATSAYLGDITTGEENYTAARSSILTELLGTASDGSRDTTTGLKLTKESFEDTDELGKQITVMLSSAIGDDVEITGVNNADRGFECQIDESEVDEWDAKAGTPPRLLRVTGSLFLDKALLSSGSLVLHQVFNSTVLGQIKSHVLTQTGYAAAKLRSKQFGSVLATGAISFNLTYQVRNVSVIAYSSSDKVSTEDDVVSWKAGKYDYEQRPEGLPPRTIVRTVTRVGWNELSKTTSPIPTPAGDAPGATYRPGAFSYSEDKPKITPDGTIYTQAWSQVFVRRVYDGGAQGVVIV